jgi:glycosyltransferase involved in cell wall biosynthesis
MREQLVETYPSLFDRVHVIPQPVPFWLLESELQRKGRMNLHAPKLNLIYPAANYQHKNHSLLTSLDPNLPWPISELSITLDSEANPAKHLSWVNCCGFLNSAQMIEHYSKVDALLFLSKKESYGFPLVEAMFIGLPIVCPDLPYARALCGDRAFYFDPDNPSSLFLALVKLHSSLDQGWWPDWGDQLKNIPSDWSVVARQIYDVVINKI